MMNRKFTTRELILMLIAAFLGLSIFYYEVVYKGVQETILSHDPETLQDQLTVYQAQAVKMKQMESEIASVEDTPHGEIAVYNNQANEILAMDSILNGVSGISITWASPVLTDTTVRRQAAISFTADSYDQAKTLVNRIHNMQYRNVISNLNISGKGDSLQVSSLVNVSMTVTFFETTNGAASQEGLVIDQSTTSDQNNS